MDPLLLLSFAFMGAGSLVAALLWIAASGRVAGVPSTVAGDNKTWGSLAAVIVMLTVATEESTVPSFTLNVNESVPL